MFTMAASRYKIGNSFSPRCRYPDPRDLVVSFLFLICTLSTAIEFSFHLSTKKKILSLECVDYPRNFVRGTFPHRSKKRKKFSVREANRVTAVILLYSPPSNQPSNGQLSKSFFPLS